VFHPRCPLAEARCSAAMPATSPVSARLPAHRAACFVTVDSPPAAAAVAPTS
jgi:hypothetical protein